MIVAATAAFVVDWLVGDPPFPPHPVRGIGWLIGKIEQALRQRPLTPQAERWRGTMLVVTVLLSTVAATCFLLWLTTLIHPLLGKAVEIWLISTTLATRGLSAAGKRVAKLLREGKLEEARREAGMMVSRDTSRLSSTEVVRATVESVAENIVDAVVAPLFYACLGGAPLAMVYRAANTLDSMVGYKNERYLYFGFAAAKLDDGLNWLPARITGLLLVPAAWLSGASGGNAWRIIRRDAAKHPSPNSGIPEAGVAGALGIRLGGYNVYGHHVSFRAYMGEAQEELAVEHIDRTRRILRWVPLLFLALLWLFKVGEGVGR